jgi:hypothetical protein
VEGFISTYHHFWWQTYNFIYIIYWLVIPCFLNKCMTIPNLHNIVPTSIIGWLDNVIYSLVKQELLVLPEHLGSPRIFSGDRITRSLGLCVMLCRSLFVLLYIELSVLVRLTVSDWRFLIAPLIYSYSSDCNYGWLIVA